MKKCDNFCPNKAIIKTTDGRYLCSPHRYVVDESKRMYLVEVRHG